MDCQNLRFLEYCNQCKLYISKVKLKENAQLGYADEDPFDEFQRNGKEVEFNEDVHSDVKFDRQITRRTTNFIYQEKKKGFCRFCFKNGEPKDYYESHHLKNHSGLILCPVLRNFVCPICKATGSFAHTLKYCPYNIFPRKNKSYLF